jgi:anti-anti-sigma factor
MTQTSPGTPASGGSSQFVRLSQQHGVLTAQPVGPAVAEREAGIIDGEIAAAITQAGASLKAVVLDLTHVTFMSSMGLSVCINTRNRANAAKVKTVVYGLNDDLLHLFRMVRLDKFFPLLTKPEELAKALGR